MKFLLVAINAKYIHSNLAVYSLQAYAKDKGYDVDLMEFTINQPKDYILQTVYEEKADAVFFSCYVWNIEYVKAIAKNLHRVNPGLPIYLGGPEVSFDAKKVLEELPFLAGIMEGEGEASFVKLLETGEFVSGAKKVYETIPVDMDTLPFVYDKMDMETLTHRIPYYESSRGCPFSCSYCLSSVDKNLRFRSMDLVKKELQFFIDAEVPQVKFVDRTFNCKKDRAMEIWQYLVEHDQGKTNFHFEIAADLLTNEQLDLMKTMRPGLIQLEIGVQSTNPKTLEEIRRTMDFSEVTRIVKEIQKGHNIHQHLDLIAGLPYEDYESFRHSFDEVYALKPDQLQLGFLKVLKGSYMAEKAKNYGCIFREEAPYEVLATNWVSYDEMIKLKSVDKMVDIYYNSGQFTCSLPLLEAVFDSPFDLFLALGEFYKEQGYEAISHSRIRRYDILLEFAESLNTKKSQDGQKLAAEINEKMLQEGQIINLDELKRQMSMDLYLRERLKKAPTWAIELTKEYDFDYENRDPLTGNAHVNKKDA